MNEWNKHCARPKTNLAAAAVSARLFEEGHEFYLEKLDLLVEEAALLDARTGDDRGDATDATEPATACVSFGRRLTPGPDCRERCSRIEPFGA